MANILVYEPIYWHMILHKAEELIRINPPPLRIEGRAPQHYTFSSERSRAALNANLPLARVQGWEEGVTSSSLSSVPLDSSDREEEEREEVVSQLVLNRRQNWMIPVIELKVLALPISILSSDNQHSEDLAYASLWLIRKVEIAHSFKEANDSDTSIGETNMVKFRTLA